MNSSPLLYELNHQNNNNNENNNKILNVKFNKTGTKIISITSFNVYIWDISTMLCIEKMNFSKFNVSYICFNENNDTEIAIGLISIDDKGTMHNKSQIHIYNIITMECIKILHGHENSVTNILFTNKFIITESSLYYDLNDNISIFNAVIIWDHYNDFTLIGSLNQHIEYKSFKYKLSCDNSLIAVYNSLSNLNINPLFIFNSNLTEFGHIGVNVVNMIWSNYNSVLIIQEANGTLDCIELNKSFKYLLKLNLDIISIKRYGNTKILINNFYFSPNGKFLAIKHGNFIRIWKFKRENFNVVPKITEHQEKKVKKIKDIDPPNGSGRKNFPNGSIYIGQFKSKHKKNVPHGRGIKTCVDGTILNGNWKDGIFQGKLNENNNYESVENVVNESMRGAIGLKTTYRNTSNVLKSRKSVLLSRTASKNDLNKHSSQASLRSLNNISRVKNILEELENDKLEVKEKVIIASESFIKSSHISKTIDKSNIYPYKLLINGSLVEVIYKNNWYPGIIKEIIISSNFIGYKISFEFCEVMQAENIFACHLVRLKINSNSEQPINLIIRDSTLSNKDKISFNVVGDINCRKNWNWSNDSSKIITFDENCICWIYDSSSSLIGIIENISINKLIWNVDSTNIAIISNTEDNIKIWNMTDESLQSSITRKNDDIVNNFNKTMFLKKTGTYRQTQLSSIQKQYRHEFGTKIF